MFATVTRTAFQRLVHPHRDHDRPRPWLIGELTRSEIVRLAMDFARIWVHWGEAEREAILHRLLYSRALTPEDLIYVGYPPETVAQDTRRQNSQNARTLIGALAGLDDDTKPLARRHMEALLPRLLAPEAFYCVASYRLPFEIAAVLVEPLEPAQAARILIGSSKFPAELRPALIRRLDDGHARALLDHVPPLPVHERAMLRRKLGIARPSAVEDPCPTQNGRLVHRLLHQALDRTVIAGEPQSTARS